MGSSLVHRRWQSPETASGYRSGVSMHGHTLFSHECLGFLPRYMHHIPVVSDVVKKHEETYRRHYGSELDYSRAWWTPPLPPNDAFALESRQIEALGLKPLVSLSDHDSVDAGMQLDLLGHQEASAVSVEWTIPWQPTFLHIGIHNLPATQARDWMKSFAAWTATPDADRLAEIFAALHALPEVLIVFNHPLWDEGGAGASAHRVMAVSFLARYGAWMHALELNGLRPAAENDAVMEMAAAQGLPTISGGDRHGREPNANINLTNAASFSEFVSEIRAGRHSHLLYMRQYRDSFRLRCAETMWDALRDYPEYPGRVMWSDRIWFRQDDGRELTLTQLWGGAGPGIVRNFIGWMRVFEFRRRVVTGDTIL